jgi:hypothetical protein
MKTSATGVGAVAVILLNALFPLWGVEIPEETVTEFVTNVTNVLGFILLAYGQWRRKDVRGFIFKR